ncbi:MAG: DUF721 domain-containing protein [bacterium]
MIDTGDPPEKIERIIERVLKGWGLHKAGKEQQVFRVWKDALGEPLSSNLRPLFIHQGRLVVGVRDSAWMQELQFMKKDIKKKLNKKLGGDTVREVHFKISSFDKEEPAEEDAQEAAPEVSLSPELVKEAQDAASVISDPRLREQVLATLLASARRKLEEEGELE